MKNPVIMGRVCAALLGCCVLNACVNINVTDEDQSKSLEAYGDTSFEDEGMDQFFGGRSALLLSSRKIDLKSSESSVTEQSADSVTVNVAVKFTDINDYAYGTAAAIDSRGYFVTAAHCLSEKEIYAFYPDEKNEFVPRKIRVVWKGRSSVNNFDFAIFHVPSPPARIFQWSDSFETGETVFSAGNTLNKQSTGGSKPLFTLDSFAGKLEGSQQLHYKKISYQKISHRSPIRGGNSGGPLVNKQGRLIGVNYSGTYPLKPSTESETPVGNAVRPDLNWLKAIIEKDHTAR